MLPIAAPRICPLGSFEESKWYNQCQHTSLSSGCCSVHNPRVHYSDKNVVQCVLLINCFMFGLCFTSHMKATFHNMFTDGFFFFSYKMWELETTHQCCRDPSYCNGVGVIKNFPLIQHSYFLNHVLHVHKCKSNCQFFTWCKSEAITCQTIMQEQLLWHHFMTSENLK